VGFSVAVVIFLMVCSFILGGCVCRMGSLCVMGVFLSFQHCSLGLFPLSLLSFCRGVVRSLTCWFGVSRNELAAF
jgi:hypothetical protein